MQISIVSIFVFLVSLGLSGGPVGSTNSTQIKLSETTGDPIKRRILVDRRLRSYDIYLPDTPASRPPPVILVFHGGYGTPANIADVTQLHLPAGREGYVVVYPKGFGRSWNCGDCCGLAHRRKVDDVKFIRRLLANLKTVVNYDSRRVYATGFSNGARFVYHLACEMRGLAAIAPVNSASDVVLSNCDSRQPVPTLHLHGLADAWAPYNGGQSAYTPVGIERSIPETINIWRERNRCSSEMRQSVLPDGNTCRTYSRCSGGAEIKLCTIENLAHQWPGGKAVYTQKLGPGVADFDGNGHILEFFRKHTL